MDALTLNELRQLCRGRGLPTRGRKRELMARLTAATSTSARPTANANATDVRHDAHRNNALPPAAHDQPPAHEAKRQAVDQQARDARAKKPTAAPRLSTDPNNASHEAAPTHDGTNTTLANALETPPAAVGCFVVVVSFVLANSEQPSTPYHLDRVFTTRAAADARVRTLFFSAHPEAWTPTDFERVEGDIRVANRDNLVGLSVRSAGHTWNVVAIHVPTCPHEIASLDEAFVLCSSMTDVRRPWSPKLRLSSFHTAKDAANRHVETIFADHKPVGTTQSPTQRTFHDGCRVMTTTVDAVEWQVAVHAVAGGEVATTTDLPRTEWVDDLIPTITLENEAQVSETNRHDFFASETLLYSRRVPRADLFPDFKSTDMVVVYDDENRLDDGNNRGLSVDQEDDGASMESDEWIRFLDYRPQ